MELEELRAELLKAEERAKALEIERDSFKVDIDKLKEDKVALEGEVAKVKGINHDLFLQVRASDSQNNNGDDGVIEEPVPVVEKVTLEDIFANIKL